MTSYSAVIARSVSDETIQSSSRDSALLGFARNDGERAEFLQPCHHPLRRQAGATTGLIGVEHEERTGSVEAANKPCILRASDGDVIIRHQNVSPGLDDGGNGLRLRAD